jgi:hypothetical protein
VIARPRESMYWNPRRCEPRRLHPPFLAIESAV